MMWKHGATWLVLSLGVVGLLVGALCGFAPGRGPGMQEGDRKINEAAHAAAVAQRTLVMAHRGGAGLWPENTLHAFRGAAALGVDVLEMDLHGTRDGALVVIHDATVERTTEGAGRMSGMTLAELKKLDAGYRWTQDGGRTYPFRGKGITIPTLPEVLTALPEARLNIDIKQAEPSLVRPLCRALAESRAAARVTVASFSAQVLAEFRRECRGVRTSASSEEVRALLAEINAGQGAGDMAHVSAVQVPEQVAGIRLLTRELVEAAHRRKLQVHVWTINEEAAMQRVIALGVDGIMTDYPDKLIARLDAGARK